MSWNYRIVELTPPGDPVPFFAIQEVYYDAAGVPGGYTDATAGDDTAEGVRGVLAMMAEALDKPTLALADFTGELVPPELLPATPLVPEETPTP